MGKPSLPSIFNEHCTSILTDVFDKVTKFAKEGVYKMRKCIPHMYDGFNRPHKYHAAKAAFINKHTPAFMVEINKHYTDKWTVSLKQAASILITLYYSVCDNEEQDGTLSQWFALHVPHLHRDHHSTPLIPFL